MVLCLSVSKYILCSNPSQVVVIILACSQPAFIISLLLLWSLPSRHLSSQTSNINFIPLSFRYIISFTLAALATITISSLVASVALSIKPSVGNMCFKGTRPLNLWLALLGCLPPSTMPLAFGNKNFMFINIGRLCEGQV